MARKLAIAALALAIGIPCVAISQHRIDAMREETFDHELLYLPNERLLNSFTAGLSSVVADLLWLQCIQYTAEEFKGDFKFVWLDHMLRTITRLDPYFTDVYQRGGVLLAMLKHDDDASIELLKSGIPHNPTRWELPFEIGRTYILNRKDNVNGARYLAMAAATGDPPPFVIEWAKNTQMRHNLYDVERGMWLDIAENSGDENMRETALRKLTEVSLREACDALTKIVEQYRAETGTVPGSIDELVAKGVLAEAPQDPLGGKFLILADGRVLSTTVLDSIKQERLQLLRGWIDKYQREQGHFPPSLDALVDAGITPGLPSHPFPGGQWEYDSATGDVG
ncbi:MAG: hypothetical protein AMXMBFR82_24220 [Candidatus Hydrogenedentota bacterium]